MKMKTTRFGEFEIDESRIIAFPLGIPGFPDAKRFVLLEYKEHIQWLQAVDDPELAFIVTDPFSFFPEFSFTVDDETEKFLDVDDPSGIVVLVLLTVGSEGVTANLRAPIVINSARYKGTQVLLEDERYAFKTPFPKPAQ